MRSEFRLYVEKVYPLVKSQFKIDHSIDDSKLTISIDSGNHASFIWALAEGLRSDGDIHSAIRCAEYAIELEPTVQRLLALSRMYENAGNILRAKRSIIKALNIDENDHGAWYLLGMLLYKVNCNELAIDAFKQAVKCYPDFPTAKKMITLSRRRNVSYK